MMKIQIADGDTHQLEQVEVWISERVSIQHKADLGDLGVCLVALHTGMTGLASAEARFRSCGSSWSSDGSREDWYS